MTSSFSRTEKGHSNRLRPQWPGFFISFEGGDGTGKTTQSQKLVRRLQVAGISPLATREPGGSQGAEAIRKLLVEGDPGRWSAETEALLMFAARRDHLENTIIPALQAGQIVVCDRFVDSSMAYQGLAGKTGIELIDMLTDHIVSPFLPDLTLIFISENGQAGYQRAEMRNKSCNTPEDRFERKGSRFQDAVHHAFSEIAKRNPERCKPIDPDGTIDEVELRVWQAIHPLLQMRGLMT